MKKKTFISVLTALFIVFISFGALIFLADKKLDEILVSLCEALFTGGIVSIIPQLIDWHSSESNFSEKMHNEFLNMLEWAQSIDLQNQRPQKIQADTYKKSQAFLKLQNQYVFSSTRKRIKTIRRILLNFINKLQRNDLEIASRILEKDLIPELKAYVEPQS